MTAKANIHIEEARETLGSWSQHPELEPDIGGLFEAHIFCLPLNPTYVEKQRFVELCARHGMQGICLGLDFEGKGVIDVLATKKFVQVDNIHTPVEDMLHDAEKLSDDFEILRLKLEARAGGRGVPLTDEQMQALNERTGGHFSFEFHIKLDSHPVTDEADQELKALCAELTASLGTRVPFSCQSFGPKDKRFLNVRTYGRGLDESRQIVRRITKPLEKMGRIIDKVIEELVVFDTNVPLDGGWLEPPSA